MYTHTASSPIKSSICEVSTQLIGSTAVHTQISTSRPFTSLMQTGLLYVRLLYKASWDPCAHVRDLRHSPPAQDEGRICMHNVRDSASVLGRQKQNKPVSSKHNIILQREGFTTLAIKSCCCLHIYGQCDARNTIAAGVSRAGRRDATSVCYQGQRSG